MKENFLSFLPLAISFALGIAVSVGEKSTTLSQIGTTVDKIAVKVDTMDVRMNSNDRSLAGTIQRLEDQQKFTQDELTNMREQLNRLELKR